MTVKAFMQRSAFAVMAAATVAASVVAVTPTSSEASTRATASASGTCSHSRTTVQPAWTRASSAARSRSTFLASLGDQYHWLLFGLEPWSGQACQKQPSTKMATLRAVNAMSGRTRRPPSRSSR